MITLNFDNLHTIASQDPEKGVTKQKLIEYSDQFKEIHSLFLSREQGFITEPFENNLLEDSQKFLSSIKSHISDILVIGIGGSMLGPQSILNIIGNRSDRLKVHFIDNIDPFLIQETINVLNLSQTLVIIQSKSGNTPETVSLFLHLREIFEDKELPLSDHFVFVTDNERGYLRKIGRENNAMVFNIPSNIGGRFSVLTNIGLLIASAAEINIAQLLEGAKSIIEETKSGDAPSSYLFASAIHHLYCHNYSQIVIMPYSSRLKTFSDWAVQLIAESLGKKHDLNGKIVNLGITPFGAIGATDQHSLLQLFQEGPHDKLINFIKVSDFAAEKSIFSKDYSDLNDTNFKIFQHRTFKELIDAELKATSQSLTEAQRPNITLEISKIDEFHIGALYMFYELATAYLGEMLNVYAFNQPGVERSKILTIEFLQEKKKIKPAFIAGQMYYSTFN